MHIVYLLFTYIYNNMYRVFITLSNSRKKLKGKASTSRIYLHALDGTFLFLEMRNTKKK